MNEMTSVKPYLIRAFYEWIVDNDLSPYINVDTEKHLVRVPEQFKDTNPLVFDISPDSVREILIDNEAISCQAKFNGIIHNLYLPIPSISAIYAQENNQGMAFPEEEFPNENEQEAAPKTKAKKLKLKVIDGKDKKSN